MARVLELVASRIRWLLCAFALFCGCTPAVAQTAPPPAALTADQVMARVEAMNQLRAQRLEGYSSMRTYHLEIHGLFSREAEMVVRADYRAPNSKQFTVISESGSGAVRKRVFRRLLQTELESMDPQSQRHTALTAENYRFQLVDHYGTGSDEFYVLKVEPKNQGKFLIAGQIWVDAADFAVTKVDGQPAVNPSWWTKSTDFNRIYRHVGEFWLPESNHSVTKVRIFGTAVLTITYRDYRIKPLPAAAPAPDPPVKTSQIASPGNPVPTVTAPDEALALILIPRLEG